MDVAKRYTIAYKGLKPGVHRFDFEVDDALFQYFESPDIKSGHCAVTVDLRRAETMLECDVEISGRVTVECDRCLEDCEIPVEYAGRLVVKFAEEIREYDGEVLWLSPAESEVDLAQYIYESIVLSLPYQRVHPEGECNPEMLERFRIVSEGEFAEIEAEAAHDGESAGGPGWAEGLAALKERMEREAEEK